MSAVTEADNDDQAAELLAAHNVIDGLSLVISQQQAVMRQALEALEHHTAIKHPQQIHYRDSAIDALRTALANGDNLSPVGQEPFGYFNNPALDGWQDCSPDDEGAIALYEAPQPAKREPLTTQEIDAIFTQVASTQEVYDMAAIRQSIARAIERAHGITGGAK